MNRSQTPTPGCLRIGWRRPSQPLKWPTTLTRLAFGAHTAKRDAVDAVDGRRDARRACRRAAGACPRPGDRCRDRRACGRTHRGRPFPRRASPRRYAQPIAAAAAAAGDRAEEEAVGDARFSSSTTSSPLAASITSTASASGAKALMPSRPVASRMRAEHAEGIAMPAARRWPSIGARYRARASVAILVELDCSSAGLRSDRGGR